MVDEGSLGRGELLVRLMCGACASKVQKILSAHPAVQEVHVSLSKQSVVVTFDPAFTSIENLKDMLLVAGFPTRSPSDRLSVGSIEKSESKSFLDERKSDERKEFGPKSAVPYITESKALTSYKESPLGSDSSKRSALNIQGVDDLTEPLLKGESEVTPLFTTITVGGMSCASCVNTIENHLKGVPGIIKVEVSLVLQNAIVRYLPNFISPDKIIQEIEDIGFDASLPSKVDETVTIVIGGMSCATCVNSIETHLKSIPGILHAEVSLVLQNARVNFLPNVVKATKIVEEIEDIGFEASIAANPSVVVQVEDSSASQNAISVQQDKEIRGWLRLLIISLVFSVPVFAIAMILPRFESTEMILMTQVYKKVTVMALLLWALCTPVQFIVGWTFYVSAFKALKHGSSNMAVLITLGTTGAYVFSLIGMIFDFVEYQGNIEGSEHFFETSSTLITFVVLGKYLESVAKQRTSQALTKLMDMQPDTANLVEFDDKFVVKNQKVVPTSSLKIGDIVMVLRGEKIPIDGVIVKGASAIQEAMLTGESIPQSKGVGDEVYGACINVESPIFIRVTSIGDQTTLSKIIKLMEQASVTKAEIQSFADKVSGVFVPIVVFLALLTFVIWFVLSITNAMTLDDRNGQSPLLFSLLFCLSVITVACPCALGLATPTAVMVGTGVGAKHGLLIKGGKALESAQKIGAVMFDKTGTLTVGKPAVTDIRITRRFQIRGGHDDSVLFLAGSAERESEHPLGRAIVEEAKRRSIQLSIGQHFQAKSGRGLQCMVEGNVLHIGNREWMTENGITIDSLSESIMQYLEESGKTALCLSIDNELAAVLGVADVLKPESIKVVEHLKKSGLQVWMVTGDNHRTAQAIARQLNIDSDKIVAAALPSDKLETVSRIQDEGLKVAFVGDGINDSPAMVQADLAVAIGAGSDIAIESADIVLMKSDLWDLVRSFHLSKVTFNRIKLNFLWALLFNTLGIPLAAGVFYPFTGIRLSPEFAALAMASSSLLVLSSSLLLNYYSPPKFDREVKESAPAAAGGFWSGLFGWRVIPKNEVSTFLQDSSVATGGHVEECCKCSNCGLISDDDIAKLFAQIEKLRERKERGSLTEKELSELPDLSLCACKCSHCMCHRAPSTLKDLLK